jgi:glucokinase
MITAGIDLGGTTIKIGIVENGQIGAVKKIPADSSGLLIDKLPEIATEIESLMSRYSLTKPDAVGMAFPSIVDSDSKKILSDYVKFKDASTIDIAGWFHERWGVPLALENDARAALVGEWKYGSGQGYDNIVMCTLGTGFGSASLCNGRLLKGAHYVAGNLGGHMTIDFQGDLCNCGGIGCVETHASSWVLESKYGQGPRLESSMLSGLELNFKSIFECASSGDDFATSIRDHTIDAWGAAVINLVHAFDPSVVLFSGGVMKQHETILPRIQKKVDDHTWPPAGTYKMMIARNPEDAGVLGIAHLAGEELSN